METYVELDVHFPDELRSLRDNAHRFAKEVMRPAAAELDRLAEPQRVIDRGSPLWSVYRRAYELGYHTYGLPTELGGLGLRGLGVHVLHEEMGWGSADMAISLMVAGFPFLAIASTGSRELIAEFVTPFVHDREPRFVGCWAGTEPQHGSDWVLVGTPGYHDPKIFPQVVARRDGDSYVISGQKSSWVSNGSFATHALLWLGIDRTRGMSGGGVAIVPLNLPGVSRGKPLNKLGQRALNQGAIFFDDVRIPSRYMICDSESERFEATSVLTLTEANASMAAVFTGLARAAFEAAFDYSRQRVQGGKPICEHQLVQKHLFDMFTKLEACRSLSRTAMVYNQTGPAPALEYSIAAKVFCTEAAFEIASCAMQTFGGNGLSREYPMEKLFRDARAALVEDGTTDALTLAGARRLLDRH